MGSRFAAQIAALFLISGASAQTPPKLVPAKPVIPQTPDVTTPAPLVLPPPAEVTIGSQPLTVQEAVAIALRLQPQIGIAQGNLLSAKGQTEQASSALRPQVSGAASLNDQATFRGAHGTPRQYSAGATATQLLFDFGRTRDFVREQVALERSSRATLTRTQQSSSLQVKQAFYTLVQTDATISLTAADVQNRQRQFDEASARVSSGLGSPSDMVLAKTNLADANISLVYARDGRFQAQISLAQSLGIDPRTPITPAEGSELDIAGQTDLAALVKTALIDRPDVLAAREQVAAAVYGVSYARKTGLPQVQLSTGIAGSGPNDPLYSQTGALGLNLTWIFADGGLAAGEVKSARGAEKVARETLVQVSQQAVADVSSAFVDVQAAGQRSDLAQAEVANAQELLRISEGRYRGGLGLFLDVTTAQSSLVSAQTNLAQARADLQIAKARLRNAIGAV